MRKFLTFAVLTAASSSALVAQGPPCDSLNDATTSVSTGFTPSPFVGRNPSWRAYQWTPTNSLVVESGSIFTASAFQDDFMRMEIWDDNGGAPGMRLTFGTWKTTMSATAAWWGTNFDTVLPLVANTPYWIIFVDSAGSIIPEEPGGVLLTRRTAQTTTPVWGTPGAGALKFRLYCNAFDANMAPSGASCPSSSGQLPSAFTNQQVLNGNGGFYIEGANLPGGAAAFLLIGFDPFSASIPLSTAGFPAGCALHITPVVTLAGMTGIDEIGAPPTMPRPEAFGHVTFPLGIPADPGVSGLFFQAQIFCTDAGAAAPIQLITTNAVQATIP